MTTAFIGQPVSRVDGRQKVTGTATYAYRTVAIYSIAKPGLDILEEAHREDARRRLHAERQRIMGVPEELIELPTLGLEAGHDHRAAAVEPGSTIAAARGR